MLFRAYRGVPWQSSRYKRLLGNQWPLRATTEIEMIQETTKLNLFLKGARLFCLSENELEMFYKNTGRDPKECSLCRILLTNGRSVIAEGAFTEPVPGFLHFHSPMGDETFMMVPHSSIASISYSE